MAGAARGAGTHCGRDGCAGRLLRFAASATVPASTALPTVLRRVAAVGAFAVGRRTCPAFSWSAAGGAAPCGTSFPAYCGEKLVSETV